jgi:hypothetical protein
MQLSRIPILFPCLRSTLLGVGLLLLLSGCTICSSPYDDDYGGFVSKTPRSDMRHGRVGSLFSDPDRTESTVQEVIDDFESVPDGMEIPDPVLP